MKHIVLVLAAVVTLGLSVSACGDSGGSAGPDNSDDSSSGPADSGSADSGPASGASALVMDGEELEVLRAGPCYFEPQDAAGVGGQILATAQMSARSAAGQDVNVDFTRFDADSDFHGDSIEVSIYDDVGDNIWLAGSFDEGTVSVSDGTVTVSDLELSDGAAGVSAAVSFEISC